MKTGDRTYVAPDTKTSTVLAFVKPDKVVIRMAQANTMTINRSARLASVFRMTMGTRRKVTTKQAISDLVTFSNKDTEKTDTFSSRETPRG